MTATQKHTTHPTPSSNDTFRWIAGLLLLFAGLYFTVSVVCSYFTWEADQSIVTSVMEDPRPSERVVENPCGYAGAWMAERLVGRSFGLFGLLVPVILTLVGLRVLRWRPVQLNKTMLTLLFVLILGSLTLGFLFGEGWGMFGSGWGGALGIEVSRQLTSGIGGVGTVILLLGAWILLGVFINRNFIHRVNRMGASVIDTGEKFMGMMKQSVASKPEIEEEVEESEEDIIEDPESVYLPATPVADTEIVRPTLDGEDGEDGGVNDTQMFMEIDISPPPLVYFGRPVTVPPPAETLLNEDGEDGESGGAGNETDDDGFTVITVEEHRDREVDERDIEQSVYDPLKDLYDYQRPPVSLLTDYVSDSEVSDEEIYENKSRIEQTLKDFGIPIQRIKATVGPTVTLYEIVQAQGVKISRIQGLENDIAQSLKALGIRIIAPIPGKGTIGIEVPNRDKQIVSMYSSIRSAKFQESKMELPVVIGRTIQNENYVFDLAKMPHLLVAGATGQGKSVGLNAIITSLLYKKHPAQLKFVMIDPKMVEFSLYGKLEKHFLAKMESEEEAIITDPRKAVHTLNALCIEMDARLELCKLAGARNIAEYNEKFTNRRLNPEKGHRYLPYIVVVVDEFADLIMTAREVEAPVMRLAQKARAVGIHLIIATQRPDVKVITGGIKANFPARIAFRVMQMIDSRTIIDQPGANQLIGRGDMLLSKDGELTRIQCALVETVEVDRIVHFIAGQQGYTEAYRLPDYVPEGDGGGVVQLGSESGPLKYDPLFSEVARDAVMQGQISTSYIQRTYEVGFNRAGRIMMQLERSGIVGRQEGQKARDILFHDALSLEAKLRDLGL